MKWECLFWVLYIGGIIAAVCWLKNEVSHFVREDLKELLQLLVQLFRKEDCDV